MKQVKSWGIESFKLLKQLSGKIEKKRRCKYTKCKMKIEKCAPYIPFNVVSCKAGLLYCCNEKANTGIPRFLRVCITPLLLYKRPVLVPAFCNWKKSREDFSYFMTKRQKVKSMFGVLQQATGGFTPWAARVALLLPNVRVILGVSCCLAWIGRLFFESTNTENFFPCKSMVIASLLRTILAYLAYALYFWIAGKICALWTRTWGWQYSGWFWDLRNCRTQQVLSCLILTLTSGMV